MREKWRGSALALVASLLIALLVPARALADPGAPAAAQAVSVSVAAKNWANTGVNVTAGQELRITAAGTWTDGSTTSGPDGSAKLDADNFFNLADLGVCNDCATTATTDWGALIGYVGTSPPAQGSYSSAAIRAQAIKVFYVGGSYAAKVLTTGRLWLAKNADAYSGYTTDNSGHVTAKVTVLPAQTAGQVAAQGKVTALAVRSAAPLLQAEQVCVRAIVGAYEDQVISGIFDRVGLGGEYDGATIANGYVEFEYEAGDGQISNAEFTYGQLIFETIGAAADQKLIPPQFALFGILGPPAIDCVEAAWWLDGWLGGQLGQYLRQKIWPAATASAGISGTWTFTRDLQFCDNLEYCITTPIVLEFSDCTATTCVMTRQDGLWQAHTITRGGNETWTAKFTDNAFLCGSQQNTGAVTLSLIVTSSTAQGGVRVAKTLGGTEAGSAATNPPTCPANPSVLQDVQGVRS